MVGAHQLAALQVVKETANPTVKAYLIRRLLLVVPTFIGISMISFFVVQMAPGSPVYMKLRAAEQGMSTDSDTKEIIEQTRKLYGLDQPIYVQYVKWLGRLVTLNFGDSFKDHRPVRDKILEALPVTLQLNIISIFLIYVIAIPIGVYSSTHQHTWSDSAITVGLFILYSMPSYWVAMLLIYFFGGGEWFD